VQDSSRISEVPHSPLIFLEDISRRFAGANLAISVRTRSDHYCTSGGGPSDALHAEGRRLADIGCIQTVFEGLATYHLFRSGRIDPRAPLSEYLSEFSPPGHIGREIKVEHLMSHSTGFHAPVSFFDGDGFRSTEEMFDFFSKTSPTFSPGSVSSLNSLSRMLLHSIVERISGDTIYQLIERCIFSPNEIVATYVNTETGWPMLLFSMDDLSKIPDISIGGLLFENGLVSALEGDLRPVVRGIRAPKASTPVGYAWGLGLFGDGTWGLNSNMAPNTAGLRFRGRGDFSVALSLTGNHMMRDLIMQFLTTSLGEGPGQSRPGLMGSLVGCEVAEIAGIYRADTPDIVAVSVAADEVKISIIKDSSATVNIALVVRDGGMIFGNGRWDSLQIEFFRHPDTQNICLLLGQIVYVSVSINN